MSNVKTSKRLSIIQEWQKLRNEVIRKEEEIASGSCYIPTTKMCELLIVGEDHRFKFHPGVDPIGLLRAIWRTYILGDRQGGSTIAMQFVRTITGRYERTLTRKIHEIILAVLLTLYFGKERLPMLYLHIAYYGWRMNNFNQACSRLSIKPDAIDELEAARLVARLKYPEPSKYQAERTNKINLRAKHIIALMQKFKTREDSYGTIQNCYTTPTIH